MCYIYLCQPQPTYICRHIIEAINIPGFTVNENGRTHCMLSMSSEIRTRPNFDVLVNKGHGAKLVWKSWSKFLGRLPDGVISSSSTGHVSKHYYNNNNFDKNVEWHNQYNLLWFAFISSLWIICRIKLYRWKIQWLLATNHHTIPQMTITFYLDGII